MSENKVIGIIEKSRAGDLNQTTKIAMETMWGDTNGIL